MYAEYSGHWRSALTDPSAPADSVKFAKIAEKTPHVVFTRGDFKPDWQNTRVAHDPAKEIARLKAEDGKDMVAWGGATFASELVNLGLVDEYRIALNPTAIGRGKSMFDKVKKQNKLKLIDTRPLPSGLVILRYK